MERPHRGMRIGFFVRSIWGAMLCLVLLGAGMTAEAVRIAAIADYGDGGPNTPRVADLVRSWEPDVIITAGDNCYAPGDHLSNVDPYYGDYVAADRLFPAIGNHDRDDCGGYDAYFAYFGVPGRYYALELGPVHVFFLNSELDEPDGVTSDSPQAQWLQAALAASTAPWKIVIAHRPPYSSGVEHGSHGYMQWPFQDWGATHVLSGDDHLFEALEVDGLPYFVNVLGGAIIHEFGPPIAGSLFRYNADHGAMLIEADASFMMLTFYSVSEGPLYFVTFTSEDEDGEVTLTVSPTTVAAGDTVTATWTGIPNPTPTDWLGLYTPGASNTAYLAWIYVSCTQSPGSARAAGSCAFPVPSTLAPGTYELRLLANNGFTALATSSAFTVTSP
jgi:tartrate-resistant acid phosphatase type 5